MREVIEDERASGSAQRRRESRENDVEATIEIKGNVGAVVGKGGSTVKSIKHQLRCHFNDRDSEIVTIRGPAKRLSSAKLVAEAMKKSPVVKGAKLKRLSRTSQWRRSNWRIMSEYRCTGMHWNGITDDVDLQ